MKPLDEWEVKLSGLNMDSMWENIIVQIGGVEIAEGHTIDQQIAADVEGEKLLRRIELLEQHARREKQPRHNIEACERSEEIERRIAQCLNTP